MRYIRLMSLVLVLLSLVGATAWAEEKNTACVTIDGQQGMPGKLSNVIGEWQHKDNAMLTLLGDCTVDKPIEVTGDNLTLNLNGYTLSASNKYDVILQNTGVLTITGNGKISVGNGIYCNAGSVTVTAGTVIECAYAFGYCDGSTIDLTDAGQAVDGWKIRATTDAKDLSGIKLPAGYGLYHGEELATEITKSKPVIIQRSEPIVLHNIKINTGIANGTVSASGSAEEGESITVVASPEPGYVLEAIIVTDQQGNDITVEGGVFTMPAAEVTISATFKLCEHPESSVTDGKCTCGAALVAQVDNMFYADFAKAVDAWAKAENATLVLLTDGEYTGDVELPQEGIHTFQGGEYTLKLSGGAIVNHGKLSIESGSISSDGEAEISIEDGMVTVGAGAACSNLRVISHRDDAEIGIGTTDKCLNLPNGYAAFVDGSIVNKVGNGAAVTIQAHAADDHAYNYTADETNKRITASCGCGATLGDIAITALDATIYDGHEKLVRVTGELEYTLVYMQGEQQLDSAPVNAGEYTVIVTAGEASVAVNFSVAPADLTIIGATVADVEFNQEGAYTLHVTDVQFDGLPESVELRPDTDYTATATLKGDNVAGTKPAVEVTVMMLNGNYSLKQTTVETVVNIAAHQHAWTFQAEGASIVATCSGKGCTENQQRMTISAPADLVYSGAAKEAILSGGIDGVDAGEISYTGDRVNVTDEGCTASITVEGTTATVHFQIEPRSVQVMNLSAEERPYKPGNTAVTLVGGELQGRIPTDDVGIDLAEAAGVVESADAGEEKPVTVTGVALKGSAAGNYRLDAQMSDVRVTIHPQQVEKLHVTGLRAQYVYTGNEIRPEIVLTDDASVVPMDEYSVAYSSNTNVGTAKITITGSGNYSGETTVTFAIVQSGAAVTAATFLGDELQTVFTYGDVITVKGNVTATGEMPVLLTAAQNQVALFYGEKQISGPAAIDENGAYVLNYDTCQKDIVPGDGNITLEVHCLADEATNLANAVGQTDIKLQPRALTVSSASAAGRAYNGGNAVAVTGVTLDGLLQSGDEIAVHTEGVDGEISSADAGAYDRITLPGLMLTGNDKEFYTLIQPDAAVPTQVTISGLDIAQVERPDAVTLDVHCATAAEVISLLPPEISGTDAAGGAWLLPVTWVCANEENAPFSAEPGADNTFAWTINAGSNFHVADGALTGMIVVTNAAAKPVSITAQDAAITYNGESFDVRELFTMDANAGEAAYEIVDGDGEGVLNGTALTITRAGKIVVRVRTAAHGAYAAAEKEAVLTVSKGVPVFTVPTGLTAACGQTLAEVALPAHWRWKTPEASVGEEGSQMHTAIYQPDEGLWHAVEADVTITVHRADEPPATAGTYLGDTPATAFTYGDVITVKVQFPSPAQGQLALFCGGKQISGPVGADDTGAVVLTYRTTDKAVPAGDSTITVQNENGDTSFALPVTIKPVELEIIQASVQSRPYILGDPFVKVEAVRLTDSMVSADDVAVDVTGLLASVASADAGGYTEVLLPEKVSLIGEAAQFYKVKGGMAVPADVEITKAVLQPAGTPTFKNIVPGTPLKNVPTSAVEALFDVPGTVVWDAPESIVAPGGAYAWRFIPTDTNYAAVTGMAVIVPQAAPQPPVVITPEPITPPEVVVPPVMVYPSEDQQVTGSVGDVVILSVTVNHADSYQWYVDRRDGVGFCPINGANSPRLSMILSGKEDGYVYLCRAANEGGVVSSPAFVLTVLPEVDIPLTGDASRVTLWLALLLLSAAGLLTLPKITAHLN